MARLWEALTPASGSAAPWSHLVPATESPSPWPAESIAPDSPPDSGVGTGSCSNLDPQLTVTALDQAETDSPLEAPEISSVSTEFSDAKDIQESESLWSDSEEGSAYVEVGPENEFRVSAGVEVPRFRSHFNLLTMDEVAVSGKVQTPEARLILRNSPTKGTEGATISAAKSEMGQMPSVGIAPGPVTAAVKPSFIGTIAAPVIRGILERLKHHAQGDLAPWLFLSPGTADCGLSPEGLKTLMEGIIDSISRQHGPVACLEIDAPMDGGIHSPGPGWQDLLWGRVELAEILVPGRNPLVTRIPRGDDYQPEGTWFATRSIHGVAQEIRQRFGLVVVSSTSAKTDPLAKFWSAQCQGWTWVASVDLWETTPLEAQARQHAKGMPPWIGCVLVNRQAAAAVA